MTQIRFNRRPYEVVYYKDGARRTIRRRPPPKLHDILPKDIVRLNRQKNQDWPAGKEISVRHINTRHPNVLQLQDDSGNTTFVEHYDLDLIEKVSRRENQDPRDLPINNRYLTWP